MIQKPLEVNIGRELGGVGVSVACDCVRLRLPFSMFKEWEEFLNFEKSKTCYTCHKNDIEPED